MICVKYLLLVDLLEELFVDGIGDGDGQRAAEPLLGLVDGPLRVLVSAPGAARDAVEDVPSDDILKK